MKVAILTRDDPHHKHLCVRLAKKYNVVGILHPAASHGAGRLRRLRNWARMYGWPLALLSASSAAPRVLSGWTMKEELAKTGEAYYGTSTDEYEKLDRRLIHRAVDVKSAAAREMIGRLDPDVVVALGGPIYPPEFIASCRLILNFHSGISPIYNGSSTIGFAFANGHPHLCGGTLMKMNAAIETSARPSADIGAFARSRALFASPPIGEPLAKVLQHFLARPAADLHAHTALILTD